VSPLSRRRIQAEDLERQSRPLEGRRIDLSAGPALDRDDEVELLLRVLGRNLRTGNSSKLRLPPPGAVGSSRWRA